MHPDDDHCYENAGHVDLEELCTERCSHHPAFFAQSVNGADVQRSAAHSEAARCLGRSSQARSSLPVLFLLGTMSMVQLHSASAYLIKSHLYWERVGAFPHYLTGKPGLPAVAWPISSLCYNGPSCAKNTPDYRCNPDCGNPNIALKNDGAYPKAYLIRFVSSSISTPIPVECQHSFLPCGVMVRLGCNQLSHAARATFVVQVIDLVVDISLWDEVFEVSLPELHETVQLGTFCRDTSIPLTVPDNCETELPFFVMNITNEGFRGYAYLQHTAYWDYSTSSGI